MVSSASFQEPLAKLVEHYQVFLYEHAAATDREQQSILYIRCRMCWEAIQAVLASSTLAQEQLATLVGLYLVLRDAQGKHESGAATSYTFLRTQLRACWEVICGILDSRPIASEPLFTLVSLYQVLLREQSAPSAPLAPDALRRYLHSSCELILNDLDAPLTNLAWRWLRSNLAQDMCRSRADTIAALKLSAFADIIRQLPTLQIHPHKNVRAYLLRIAHWGLYTQNGLYLPSGADSRRSERAAGAAQPGTPDAAMWPLPERSAAAGAEDFKARIQEELYDQQCTEALRSFVARALPPDVQRIFAYRWRDTPLEYAAIASALGNGATAVSVRVHYHRGITKLRIYIETRVLLAMRDPQCAAEIWAFAQRALAPDDLRILEIRWRKQPPTDVAAIAAALGDGWTEAQVRSRHQRAMAYIFAHMRSLGMIDLEG